MKKVLALGASNSSRSINKSLAHYTAQLIENVELELIDLNDYEMPIFSIDREEANGIPDEAKRFKALIAEADGIIISFAEHNGAYSTAFKNILDWCSRVEKSMWNNKPMLMMGTSPGGRGARTVIDLAVSRAGFMDGNVVAEFSLPFFSKNFNAEEGIIDEPLKMEHQAALSAFVEALEA